MVGSPNYDRIVYEGDDGPPGSRKIENAFRAYFAARHLPVEQESLGGASDHASFADVGIPVGGLFTGADDLKSIDPRAAWAGLPIFRSMPATTSSATRRRTSTTGCWARWPTQPLSSRFGSPN